MLSSTLQDSDMKPSEPLILLYDGHCPICQREIAWLRQRDTKQQIRFQNIQDENFDPAQYGVSKAALMAVIHAINSEGKLLKGLDVFIAVYTLVGLRWLTAPMRWRLTRPCLVVLYDWFARHRSTLAALFPAQSCHNHCAIHNDQPHDTP